MCGNQLYFQNDTVTVENCYNAGTMRNKNYKCGGFVRRYQWHGNKLLFP